MNSIAFPEGSIGFDTLYSFLQYSLLPPVRWLHEAVLVRPSALVIKPLLVRGAVPIEISW